MLKKLFILHRTKPN